MQRPTERFVVKVRDGRDADIGFITSTYAHWVRHGAATFELDAPAEDEMAARRARLLAGGYPYLVAELGAGEPAGYAYAGPYRSRPAYRFACEDSVYVAPHAAHGGVGRALLEALIARCDALGLRIMIAVIGDAAPASVRLHEACGFVYSGRLPAVGWKHDRWVDTVLMTRSLGAGSRCAPIELSLRGEPAP
jgi:L-amino acid N-acyltransferase YncA